MSSAELLLNMLKCMPRRWSASFEWRIYKYVAVGNIYEDEIDLS